ncbi:L-serine ammonia-lyase, iron-sulfur-dependent, subunit alpha [Bacillus tuaregi]|uniref:L-serine ammonia-lyase, iron-sulfur-dependent, subunit alpha n=1 Tax=Bacillus tuaregi TaxID=1816695 RepID=UPI0008F89F92|nr:L-serine ammonia-lyase, iron-sulfur-dependent, subunit alpha [Bacillus tuaregi]
MSFKNLQELVETAARENTTIAELMIKTEEAEKGLSRAAIIEKKSELFTVIEEAVRRGTESPVVSRACQTGGDGNRLYVYANEGNTFVHSSTLQAAANALAVSEVNEAIGRIAATPTVGSTGILPAVLVHALDSGRFTRDQIVLSTFTASALGLVIANRASISRTEGDCQVEIGSATAMAAGTLVELAGGTPEQVGHAVGIALKHSLGLVYAPFERKAEISCIYHTGLPAITALAAADMALAGVVCHIPADEIIQLMREGRKPLTELFGAGGLEGSQREQSIHEPVMGEPLSAHKAGAARIGQIAYQLLNEKPLSAKFTLMGSFAEAQEGDGIDLALLAGVLGLSATDDDKVNAKEVAERNGVVVEFTKQALGSHHPNTVLIELAGELHKVKVLASSLGGGKVEVQEFDGFPLKFSGERPTLIIRHSDRKGVIADLSWIIQEKGCNIARMGNERSTLNGPALTICEVDNPVDESLLAMLKREIPIIDEILLVQK